MPPGRYGAKYNTYGYSKKRREFGIQPLFQDVPAQIIDSIYPNRADQKDYILRNPVNKEVQATLAQSEHDANTTRVIMREQGINHVEGGWPRDVQIENEEHVLRHRRRVMHEENYIHTILHLSPSMEHFIDQNNAIEMYQSYFSEMPHQEPVEKYSVRCANVFRDTMTRPVACVLWTNETHSKLVVAYSSKELPQETNLNSLTTCYIWDVNKQNEPLDVIEPADQCWQLACSPVEPEIIACGLSNGTVSLFDLRESKQSIADSSPYNSHRGPITALLYTHSRANTEFFTGSTDGQCIWWDTRNLSQPLETLPMSVKLASGEEPNLGNSEGVSSFQFDRGLPTKFLCGTESGLVINVNRMGRSHSEILCSYWNAHAGPVRAVHRSPCTSRMFMTCGEFSVRIWSEEVRSAPIIVTKPYRHEVTDVAWAPQRYSSYMSICAGGVFYYWDLLRKHCDPIATLHVSKHELTKVTPHAEGEHIAVGDVDGSVFLLQLSENMTVSGRVDKQLIQGTYQRETKREHILDNRLKEIRLKMRDEEEAANLPVPEEPDEEELVQAAEDEYLRIVQAELRGMEGSIVSTRQSQ